MVIDKQIWVENAESKSVDSADNKTIDIITIDGIDYHFAKENQVVDGVCDNAVNEPLIDMQIHGNSIQGRLPSEYQQVEYIQNDGTQGETQYIDTGVLVSENNSFEVKAQLVNADTTSQTVWGGRHTSTAYEQQANQLSYVKSTGTYQFACGNNSDAEGLNWDTELHIFYANKNTLYIDDVSRKTVSTAQITESNNVYLFATNTAGTVGFGGGSLKMYYCKIWIEDKLVRDYIPCYRIADNVVGFYDLVEQKFYTNMGTGNFTAGLNTPTPETPIKIESVGEKTKNLLNIENPEKINITGTDRFAFTLPSGLSQITVSAILKDGYVEDSKQMAMFVINSDGTHTNIGGFVPANTKTRTYNLDSSKQYVFAFISSSYEETFKEFINKYYWQIEEGSTATDYEPYGYKVPVKVGGKNLFDGIFEKGIISASNGNNYDHDTITRSKNFIPVNELTEYTFSTDDLNVDSIYLYEFGNDYSLLSHTVYSMTNSKVTITTKENTKYIRFSPRDRVTNVALGLDIKVQLEKGSVATEYESYIQPTITNIYLGEPLRKIGDYADYIDYKNKKVVRKITTKTFTGQENIGAFDSSIASYCPYPYTYYILGKSGLVVDDVCLCTHLQHQSNFSYQRVGNNKFRVLNSVSNNQSRIVFRFYLNGAIVENTDEVKALLTEYYNAGTPMIVYYAHADEFKTEELIVVPELSTFDGTTIFDTDTEIKPSQITVDYWKQI